jgi:hypothetical protein
MAEKKKSKLDKNLAQVNDMFVERISWLNVAITRINERLTIIEGHKYADRIQSITNELTKLLGIDQECLKLNAMFTEILKKIVSG